MSDILGRRSTYVILAAIVAWAAVLRLWHCDSSLPGLQIDEAANVWNAYCLLKTGKDEWGESWPIFSARSFDHYRSTLYLYLLMPFQAVGGMNVCTARLPAAVGGVATVLLVYYIGRRLFDIPNGLIAVAFLALCPWHIQYSRWGNESSIVPFALSASIAALLFAGAPCIDRPTRPRIWAGFVAGLITGVFCYGYASLRIVLPVTLVCTVLAAPRTWAQSMRTRDGRFTSLAIVAGLMLTLGPLAWKHLTDPRLSQRGQETLVWDAQENIPQRAAKVLARYAPHFGPRFLFVEGSRDPALSPPAGWGWMHWYSLPLLVIGAGAAVRRSGDSLSSRFLLVLLLCYPVADLAFGQGTTPHPLRSYNGVVPLSLTAAVGAVVVLRWLASRRRGVAVGAGCGLALWALVSHILYIRFFFGSFNNDVGKYWQRHVDLMQACQWLKPRLNDVDAVFITQEMIAFPHVLTLVYLDYDPQKWLNEPRVDEPAPPTLQAQVVCTRFGKMRLIYRTEPALQELEELRSNGRTDRVVMILRPGQKLVPHAPVAAIRHADLTWLYIYQFEI